MRILLIEDDPQLQALTPRMIRRIFAHAIVEVVASASAAIGAIEREEPALIVSDFDLGPGQNGGAVLAWIKAERPALADHFVFLSGNPEIESLHHRTVMKPCSITDLRVALAG